MLWPAIYQANWPGRLLAVIPIKDEDSAWRLSAHDRLWAFHVYVVPSWGVQDDRRFVPSSPSPCDDRGFRRRCFLWFPGASCIGDVPCVVSSGGCSISGFVALRNASSVASFRGAPSRSSFCGSSHMTHPDRALQSSPTCSTSLLLLRSHLHGAGEFDAPISGSGQSGTVAVGWPQWHFVGSWWCACKPRPGC